MASATSFPDVVDILRIVSRALEAIHGGKVRVSYLGQNLTLAVGSATPIPDVVDILNALAIHDVIVSGALVDTVT